MSDDKYVRRTLGEVGADDDSFCSIGVEVKIVDSTERVVRMAERLPAEHRDDPETAWMLDLPVHRPVKVRLDWETNCTSAPGIWLSQEGALRLARLLLEAAEWTPVAHRHPKEAPDE